MQFLALAREQKDDFIGEFLSLFRLFSKKIFTVIDSLDKGMMITPTHDLGKVRGRSEKRLIHLFVFRIFELDVGIQFGLLVDIALHHRDEDAIYGRGKSVREPDIDSEASDRLRHDKKGKVRHTLDNGHHRIVLFGGRFDDIGAESFDFTLEPLIARISKNPIIIRSQDDHLSFECLEIGTKHGMRRNDEHILRDTLAHGIGRFHLYRGDIQED